MFDFDELLAAGAPPVIAILRGLKPEEAPEIGGALIEAGIRFVEVPLNSPDPFNSIVTLQRLFGQKALIGAGTVLDMPSVDRLVGTGARLMVTPNIVPEVIAHGLRNGLELLPGFLTPSEALAAVAAGAHRLKLFPASAFGTNYLGAIREILPKSVQLWAVGGANAANLRDWLKVGATGFGVGGSLYRPGDLAREVGVRAEALIAAWKAGFPPVGGG
jgi:2-dehydro-3-deoxyphosphogalactonate aldolase